MAQTRLATCMLVALAALCIDMDQSLKADGPEGGTGRAPTPQMQIVSFTSARCEPCRSMQPAIASLTREGWPIRQVDVEKEPQLVAPFQVKSLPTIIILRDRREVDRVVGALGYQKLKARFEKASATAGPSADDLLSMVALSSHQSSSSARGNPNPTNIESATVRGQSPAPPAFPMLSTMAPRSLADATLTGATRAASTLGASLDSMAAFNSDPALASAATDFAAPQPMAAPAYNRSPSTQPQLASTQPTSAQPGAIGAAGVARAQAATVRIRVDEPGALSFGTGTVINMHGDQALVLTCGHMFRDITAAAKLSVDLYDRGQVINLPAQIVSHTTEQGDIGLIEFRSPVAIAPVPIAPLAATPQVGSLAFSFGCDHGQDPTRRDTQIKRINRYLGPANIEIHGAPVVGRSGGGLFDAQGQLVGVCNAADAEDDEGIYAGLPVVHQHVAALKLDGLSPPPSNVQLASAATREPAVPATTQPGYWPDQQLASSAVTNVPPAPTQVRCVIRDAQGQEAALVIDRPSEELLALLRSQAHQ
ncbi:MAG: trypsin-like peptidase domain-containing protein [Pirellulaceae bacterium]|nr:trypsin-like peptidase domain-containing protein [Pirellulaceae bacterium]